MNYLDININELNRHEVKRIRGIYFLYKVKELVYIGQSKHILARLCRHLFERTKEFDSYSYLEINGNISLNEVEENLIRKYKPTLNICYNKNKVYKKPNKQSIEEKRKKNKGLREIKNYIIPYDILNS